MLHLVLLISGKGFFQQSGLDIYGLCSSVLMLGKDLSENLLLNVENSLYLEKPFPMKIRAMGQIFPAIILTAVFRLGTLALLINHVFVIDIGLLLIPAKLIIMVPPIVTLLIVRKKFPDIELSVVQCFVGLLEEMSGYTTWGKKNPKQSRWIQFGLNLFFCVLYGAYCMWTVFNPPTKTADTFAVIFLICGWVAFPLYISQIFFINTKHSINQEVPVGQSQNNRGQGQNETVNMNIFVI